MEKGGFSVLSFLFIVVTTLLFPQLTLGEPRAKVLELLCTNQTVQNASLFVSNVGASMEIIAPQLSAQGYGVAVSGQGPDALYGLAQCYGDLSEVDCVLCYSEMRTIVPQCFPFNGGRIFLDGCFLRSWNVSFFQDYTGPDDRVICGNETRKSLGFQETARRAVLQAALDAPNNKGYARAEMKPLSGTGTTNESTYVLANCWRTLNSSSCRACLEIASRSMLRCLPWSEGRALYAGCFMRYSDVNFLNPLPSSESSKWSIAVIIAVIISSTIVVAGVAVIGVYIWKRKSIQKKREGSYDAKKLSKILRDSSLNFKYSSLEKATSGFHEANKLGQGGFGEVYKGILPDGREIAVKRLFVNNIHLPTEFYNEVNIISCIEHKNLVKLLGCSSSGPENLLVYEFLPNKSLDRYIFKTDSNKDKVLNWEKRFEIIIGTAEGLVYLHENTHTRIIHRDIKASNILLDSKFRAKIADFGLARAFEQDKSHITTAIVGTLGYMAPEYLSHGQYSEKADVYSFGVLLLEIVTGRQNNANITSNDSGSLVTSAWKHFQQEVIQELIDYPSLELHKDKNISEVLRVIHIALLCTQEIPLLRPSMSKALQMLAKKDEDLPSPTKPPFIDEETMELNSTISNSESVATISESIFFPR